VDATAGLRSSQGDIEGSRHLEGGASGVETHLQLGVYQSRRHIPGKRVGGDAVTSCQPRMY
jgi:hypothetical protein